MMIAHPPIPPHEQHSWGHDDELQDICDHVQLHSSHMMIPEVQAPLAAAEMQTPAPSNQEESASPAAPTKEVQAPPPSKEDQVPSGQEQDTSFSDEQAEFCEVKREAIMLLSAAHKSSSGADRIKALTLLAALYKAETKEDLAVLGEKVKELFQKKKEQDEETERLRKEEEANQPPRRFWRIRSGVNRMMQNNHNSDAASVSSQPCPGQASRNARQQQDGRGWRFFWQQRNHANNDDQRRSSHSDVHGIQMPANATASASRNARMQRLQERRNMLDTRTI